MAVTLKISLVPSISLAHHQNAIPVVRDLSLTNDNGTAYTDLALTLESEPPFFVAKTIRIDALAPGELYNIRQAQVDLQVDGAQLARLTEAERTTVRWTLAAQGTEIASGREEIELLPRNQWSGISHMPQLAAAFVMPNDPVVDRILRKAAEFLHQNGRSDILDGYARGPNRVQELASAIWSAVQSLDIAYALPPASFEIRGQKVRTPSQIAENRLATCLDLSMLFCAALEQCGLNPILVFKREHAFPGVWLGKEHFGQAVVDDPAALRRRMRLDELIVFESTFAAQRPFPRFSDAVRKGVDNVSETADDDFELAIDIASARVDKIRPLAAAEAPATPGAVPGEAAQPAAPAFEIPEPMAEKPSEVPVDETPKGRINNWCRRLLDLSNRNNLLNFRVGAKALMLDAPDAAALEDRLQTKPLRLVPRPDLMSGNDVRSRETHEARTHGNVLEEYARGALDRNEVVVALEAADIADRTHQIESRLTQLYRESRNALQEGGANTLFLAIGFLSWMPREHRRADKPQRAPLLLVPVALERKSVRSGFTLQLHDDEPLFNPTLLELLRQDFQIQINELQGELPHDDQGLDVKLIWQIVTRAINDMPGWEVLPHVALGQFSFAKYLMWKDLTERSALLAGNPVVRHLIETPREAFPDATPFARPERLDAELRPQSTFCPLPADSSQLSAVLAAATGKNFVLIGPPGTGKSQTICNLIAQCLSEGKRVLFVSEKMAALDVVHRRLRERGLDEFCLELHSSKARKGDILAQLKASWDHRQQALESAKLPWERECERLARLREGLNASVARIHRTAPNGYSIFRAVGEVLRGQDRGLPTPSMRWPSMASHTVDTLEEFETIARRLADHAPAALASGNTPIAWVRNPEWTPAWRDALLAALETLSRCAQPLAQSAEALRRGLSLSKLPDDEPTLDALDSLCALLLEAHGHDLSFIPCPPTPDTLRRFAEAVVDLEEYQSLAAGLAPVWSADTCLRLREGIARIQDHKVTASACSVPYKASATSADLDCLQADWARAAKSVWPLGWARRRKVAQELSPLSSRPAAEPDVAADLPRLVHMRELERAIADNADLGELAHGLWHGLDSDIQSLEAALAFQRTMQAALRRDPWDETGLEHVAAGRCGPTAARDLEALRRMRELQRKIDASGNLATETRGTWRAFDSDATALRTASSLISRLPALLHALGGSRNPDLPSTIARIIGEQNAILAPGGSIASAHRDFRDARTAWNAALDAVRIQLGDTPRAELPALPDGLVAGARFIIANERALREWCPWVRIRDEANASGMGPLAASLADGTLVPADTLPTFQAAYASAWLDAMLDTDPSLARFNTRDHMSLIRQFRDLDSELTKLTAQHIRTRLGGRLPAQEQARNAGEWGVLSREAQKKARHLPLRELIRQIPTALANLKPCMLMSPLSIAQYLPAGSVPFDIVVFDEASQIPTWDAIGAMARGGQVVMVGDPKQLPPTNFFARAESEDAADAEEEIEDMESILDECIGAQLPTLNLSWHYRSRNESLIAFSNHRYYEGGLVTFPSPVTDDRAVSYHPVETTYSRGTASNPTEARAMVADLLAHLRDPANAKRTFGVVTFNQKQQQLVLDMLDEARGEDPDLERHFAEDLIEPVFVKNLENVQGDERDIIYFSTTFGPDAAGRVSLNFGALNRTGGERRLNVAITRARQELRVFSSLNPDQIDLSRTNSRGVKDFKHFLEFAQRGKRALGEAVHGSVGCIESPFEEAVKHRLEARGWQVHTQIGVSRFRIDLGIVDPDAPGRYLAGIECDGATYHSCATARDRDKLREEVLRGLGWEILRIWSTDWWLDAKGALDAVTAQLDSLLQARRTAAKSKPAEPAHEPPPAPAPKAEPAPHPEAKPSPSGGNLQTGEPGGKYAGIQVPTASARIADETPLPTFTELGAREFTGVNADSLHSATYTRTLLAILAKLIAHEGPMHEDVLVSRIVAIHGMGRSSPRIRERVVTLASQNFPTTTEAVGTFYWPYGKPTDTYPTFRRPSPGNEARDITEIALPELAALARELRAQGWDEAGGIQQMLAATGRTKASAAIRDRLTEAWRAC